MHVKRNIIFIVLPLSSCLFIFLAIGNFKYVLADTVDDIKSKIDERTAQIKQLEAEISQYNKEVENASKQATTLKNTLKTLDLTQKKITTDISLTDKKISKTSLTIEELGGEIGVTENHIGLNKDAIISAFQDRKILEDAGVVIMLLSNKNVHDIWNDIDETEQIQNEIRNKSAELKVLHENLETKKSAMEGQKKNLVVLKQDLTGKKQAVEYTKQEKSNLLSQTKNKEELFKELVKTKEEQKALFEKELYEYESQLHYSIDRRSYPSPRHNILSWPLDNIFVTQKFGKTVGAEKLYTSGSHNGVDFRASVGTRVKNVSDGVVVGTGNTDAYPGCYSFGKWVMVRHENGLSTIYAHLSAISSFTGQSLKTGDTVGYSGNTGYSTGPHLHITVYATQGVRIEKYVQSRGCKQVTIPLADIKAYLDPLAYFPAN